MDKKLREFNVGDKVIIIGYEGKSEQYRHRLLSMGLIKGAEIEILKVAPMGDPVEITVRDFNLSLRKHEADELIVKAVQS